MKEIYGHTRVISLPEYLPSHITVLSAIVHHCYSLRTREISSQLSAFTTASDFVQLLYGHDRDHVTKGIAICGEHVILLWCVQTHSLDHPSQRGCYYMTVPSF